MAKCCNSATVRLVATTPPLPIFDDIPRAADVALRQKQIWTMAVVAVAGTAHSNCGRWQRTAAVEWDTTRRTDGERLLLWTKTVAVATATAHSNCGQWQQMGAVEWYAAGRTNGERLLL